MDEAAQTYLWSSPGIDESYDSTGLPPIHDPAGEDFLWEELLEAAREDGNLFPFFAANESIGVGHWSPSPSLVKGVVSVPKH